MCINIVVSRMKIPRFTYKAFQLFFRAIESLYGKCSVLHLLQTCICAFENGGTYFWTCLCNVDIHTNNGDLIHLLNLLISYLWSICRSINHPMGVP